MNVLQKLDALTEPDFGEAAPFALDARVFGLLIAAFAAVSFLSALPTLTANAAGDSATVAYLVIGATLPQLLAFYGGLRLFAGDARGKRSVVFAIALGYMYLVGALLRVPAGPCGDGPGICEAAKFIGLLLWVPALAGLALLLYGLVGTLRYGRNTQQGAAIASALVTVFAIVALLGYAHGVLARA